MQLAGESKFQAQGRNRNKGFRAEIRGQIREK